MLNGIYDVSKDDYYTKKNLFDLLQKYGGFSETSMLKNRVALHQNR